MRHIWQLDDTHYWHLISEATVQQLPDWQLRHFYTGQSLLTALKESAAQNESSHQAWPHIILMDFYLQHERGDHVTRTLREFLRQVTAADTPEICIVGFSSVRSCSEQICRAGGNLIIKKVETGAGINQHLLSFLKNYPR